MGLRRALLGLLLAAAGGCSSGGPPPVMPKGPAASSAVPCLEACADSNSCRAQCQPVGNLPPPPGIMYQR